MYIELFLLDNLLMNLLVLHLTAAIVSIRPKKRRLFLFALGSAVYAAVGAGLFPALLSFPMKLFAGLPLAFFIPVHNIRELVRNWIALLIASLMAGGTVFAISIVFSEDFVSGIALRTYLTGAFVVAILPSQIRKLLARRVRNENIVQLEIVFDGSSIACAGLADTGSNLIEPITGIAVILLPIAYQEKADCSGSKRSLPITMTTAAGETVIEGFRPKSVQINGVAVNAVIGFARVQIAIVPGALMPDIKAGSGHLV